MSPRAESTHVHEPQAALRTLSADEERLVVLCCTLAGSLRAELLDQVVPERAPALKSAADRFATLERSARLASFSRHFSPPAGPEAIRSLSRRLSLEPAWLAALVCRCVPPEVREKLLASPAVRDAWHSPLAPLPPALDYARRFVARALAG